MSEIIKFKGREFERTGEERLPKTGEYYWFEQMDCVVQANANHTQTPHPILRPVSAPPQPPARHPSPTRFLEFDDTDHPANKWWQEHGQYMMSGGGRNQFIWACRGWIAREQLYEGVPVTGDSLSKKPPEAAEQAGEPGEALKALALKLFTTGPGQYEPLPTVDEAVAIIAEELRPLLEKARRYWDVTVSLNRDKEDELDAELTRWESKS